MEEKFSPGFRISFVDGLVLLAGFAAAIVVSFESRASAIVIAFVVGQFFLFCNVFRIARASELIWAAVFLALGAATILREFPGWPITVSMSLATTALVVILETRKPSYHGIAWQRINPNLRIWWNSQH